MSEARFHPEHADDNLGIPDDAGPHASERIHRLIRERDEARARVAELENIEAVEAKIAPIILKAMERGYRRGVEDAAKLIEDRFDEFGLGWHAARAILALLEKPDAAPTPPEA